MGALGKGRGKRWEYHVAEFFGGIRKWAGPGSDVEARDRIIECKSQQDYKGLTTLVKWIRQAQSYDPVNWVLAVRLGLRNNKLTFIVISMEQYEQLTRDQRTRENSEHGIHVRIDTHVPNGNGEV